MKKDNDLNGVFGLLLPEIGRAVSEAGYTTPSPIQEQSIPSLLNGRDMIGCAQTGTGKTAAFSLPILETLQLEQRRLQAIVLCPTRELCAQVAREIRKLGRKRAELQVLVISGGQPMRAQLTALEKGVHGRGTGKVDWQNDRHAQGRHRLEAPEFEAAADEH